MSKPLQPGDRVYYYAEAIKRHVKADRGVCVPRLRGMSVLWDTGEVDIVYPFTGQLDPGMFRGGSFAKPFSLIEELT